MPLSLGVVMDPIATITIKKDSTFAMMLAAQRRGWALEYLEMSDLCLRDGVPMGRARSARVKDDPSDWHTLGEPRLIPLETLDVLLMRKDPPVDQEYLYATHLLELAEARGVLVVNRPRALRDANEKLYTAWFPRWCPPTLVDRSEAALMAFLHEHGRVVFKPLHGMGGESIFLVNRGDPNVRVILETLTQRGRRFALAQRFIPEIRDGDKRILVIDGQPYPHALARIPSGEDHRGNLAAGGRGEVVPLSAHDLAIARDLGPHLREAGILFAGLDVIGDYLTEINVTSPTCIRELDRALGGDIAGEFMDVIATKVAASTQAPMP